MLTKVVSKGKKEWEKRTVPISTEPCPCGARRPHEGRDDEALVMVLGLLPVEVAAEGEDNGTVPVSSQWEKRTVPACPLAVKNAAPLSMPRRERRDCSAR